MARKTVDEERLITPFSPNTLANNAEAVAASRALRISSRIMIGDREKSARASAYIAEYKNLIIF